MSEKLLVTYGVRLVSYDRPGFGQSDPHPHRSFNSSAEDIVRIADALNLGQKFWVLAFSGGGPHAWAALKYIPERLAGIYSSKLCSPLPRYILLPGFALDLLPACWHFG